MFKFIININSAKYVQMSYMVMQDMLWIQLINWYTSLCQFKYWQCEL